MKTKPHATCALLLALLDCFTRPCLSSLYNPPPPAMAYHDGAVLDGVVPVSVLYYGAFSSHQKAVLADFLISLFPRARRHQHAFGAPVAEEPPSVTRWWETVDRYMQRAGRERTHVLLTSQVSDEGCSLGKRLSRAQVEQLAARLRVAPGGVAVVLTAADIAVDGFYASACGLHGSAAPGGAVHVWVGDAAVQCPGRCAWPFHSVDGYAYPDAASAGPRHHGRDETLRTPNGDVGVDGMVINLAALLAGEVTNPYGRGYFQGDAGAPVEVGGACPGVYGRSV